MNKVARHRRCYAVQKERAALKTLAPFINQNLHKVAHGLIVKAVTLLQFNSRLPAVAQSLLEDFIPHEHQGNAC
jgi:hypothetical protein